MITRQITIDVKPSPLELANEFCAMYDEEQAEFFNCVAEIAKTWDNNFVFQLQAIVDCGKFNEDGKEMMCRIGEYGEV